MQLSSVNCLRMVLVVGVEEHINEQTMEQSNQPRYKVVMLNKDFYEAGLQQVELMGMEDISTPNYSTDLPMFGFPITTSSIK